MKHGWRAKRKCVRSAIRTSQSKKQKQSGAVYANDSTRNATPWLPIATIYSNRISSDRVHKLINVHEREREKN